MATNEGMLTLTDCTFYANRAGDVGGAMCNWDVDPAVTNCIFWGSRAVNSGDEIANYLSTPVVSHCDIEG